MDFADVLRRRKAVRSYLPDPIPRETLERIVARGRKIPSAGHSQGLRLVVVTDEDTRRAMAELALEPEYVATGLPAVDLPCPGARHRLYSRGGLSRPLS